jgi:CheY-like chemotaxis protein
MTEAVGSKGVRRPILLAEDNNDDAALIQIAFKKAGCSNHLVHVPHGEQALQYLLGEPPYSDRARYPFPRLLLLDLAMPLMDGWGLLSHIRAVTQWDHLPVIVLTGSIDLRNAKRACAKGANAYLVKPSGLGEYVEIVRALAEEWLATPTPAGQPIPARVAELEAWKLAS